MTTKEYRIGVCKTTDIDSGEDFLPPYYKVYSIETWEDQPPTTWFEMDFDTLEEARAYIEEKKMSVVVDKYKKTNRGRDVQGYARRDDRFLQWA